MASGDALAIHTGTGTMTIGVKKLKVGNSFYLFDAPFFNVSNASLTIVSAHVTFAPDDVRDLGHETYLTTGGQGVPLEWVPGRGSGVPNPATLSPRSLNGVVIAPNRSLTDGRFTMGKYVIEQSGHFQAHELIVTYRQADTRYTEALPINYDLSSS
jgi:hypothetical protein